MKITGNYWDDVLFSILVIVIAFITWSRLRFVIGRFVRGASTKLKVDPALFTGAGIRHPECSYRKEEEIGNGETQVVVTVVEISETAIQLRAYAWAKDPTCGFILKCNLLRNIKLRFDAASVKNWPILTTVFNCRKLPSKSN